MSIVGDSRFRRVAAAFLVLILAASGARAAPPPLAVALATKLDPRLLPAALIGDEEPVSVWLALADKGEQGPADLARRLAEAEDALTPRARARRIRAGVHPLVDERDLPVSAPYVAALSARGLAPYGTSRWLNRVAVRVPASRLGEVAELGFVRRILPVERVRRSADPLDAAAPPRADAHAMAPGSATTAVAYGRTAWQLEQIGVPTLHDSGYTGAGVLVCVLDEGFNYHDKHEALRDIAVVATRDFVRGVVSVQDTTLSANFRHGTWVLGVLAGRKFGGYVGAAFDAEVALGRTEVGGSENPQEMVNWAMGAEWADSLGADIVSSSLGYFTFDNPADNYAYADMDGHTTTVSRAAEIAASKGILVVNSAGNEGNSSWHYLIAPSDVNGDSVIAVGAVDSAGVPAGFSSFGPSADGRIKPDVCARGVSNPTVAATQSGSVDGYQFLSGTSFSQPLIAGLAACLMQARPTWTPRDVARALRHTASRASNPDNKMGYGIANGVAALAFDPTASVPEGRPSSVRIALAGENPVRGTAGARVRIALAPGSAVSARGSVRVIDPQGRRVRELWEGVLTSDAPVTLSWDGRDDRGREVGRGLYFFALEAGGERSTLRLVVLR